MSTVISVLLVTYITDVQAFELERLDQQITLSLNGMGLSLVNNILGVELAYMAIQR